MPIIRYEGTFNPLDAPAAAAAAPEGWQSDDLSARRRKTRQPIGDDVFVAEAPAAPAVSFGWEDAGEQRARLRRVLALRMAPHPAKPAPATFYDDVQPPPSRKRLPFRAGDEQLFTPQAPAAPAAPSGWDTAELRMAARRRRVPEPADLFFAPAAPAPIGPSGWDVEEPRAFRRRRLLPAADVLHFPVAPPQNPLLQAESGAYTLSGQAASLEYGHVVAAASGSYSLNGQAAALKHGYVIVAASGTYAITGQTANLRHVHILVAAGGSYAINGQAASPEFGHIIVAASGTYTLSGQAATLTKNIPIAAAAGTYVVSGSAVTFPRTYRLQAESGSYILSGRDARIVFSGLGWAPSVVRRLISRGRVMTIAPRPRVKAVGRTNRRQLSGMVRAIAPSVRIDARGRVRQFVGRALLCGPVPAARLQANNNDWPATQKLITQRLLLGL